MGFTSIAYREKKSPVNVSAEYCSPKCCSCSSSGQKQQQGRENKVSPRAVSVTAGWLVVCAQLVRRTRVRFRAHLRDGD